MVAGIVLMACDTHVTLYMKCDVRYNSDKKNMGFNVLPHCR